MLYYTDDNFQNLDELIADYCEDANQEIPSKGSSYYYDLAAFISQRETEYVTSELNQIWNLFDNKKVIVFGNLGLYNKKVSMAYRIFEDLESAAFVTSAKYEHRIEMHIDAVNRTVSVDEIHHDGRNHFELRIVKLNKEEILNAMLYRAISKNDRKLFDSALNRYTEELYPYFQKYLGI